MLDLSGGNDGLSMLIPYTDSFYYSRRPTLGIPAGTVLQIGSDSSGKALGLHPKLTGLKDIFNQGRLALIQRVGYAELEPIAFLRDRHLVHGQPVEHHRQRLGRPLHGDADAAARSAGRLEHDRRYAARAAVGNRRGGIDSQHQRLRFQQSEHRHRGALTRKPRR